MKLLSVRDLRTHSARVWRELPDEGEMVVTSNGRPVAYEVTMQANDEFPVQSEPIERGDRETESKRD